MSRHVQIDETLFTMLYAYHVLGQQEHADACARGLEDKMAALVRRAEYAERWQNERAEQN